MSATSSVRVFSSRPTSSITSSEATAAITSPAQANHRPVVDRGAYSSFEGTVTTIRHGVPATGRSETRNDAPRYDALRSPARPATSLTGGTLFSCGSRLEAMTVPLASTRSTALGLSVVTLGR